MVGLKVTRASTGRLTEWETENPDDPANQVHILTGVLQAVEAHQLAQADLSTQELVLVAFTAIEGLLTELREAKLHPIRGPLFRARVGPEDLAPDTFGPPPSPQRRNRFNGEGQTALYLARSREVLGAEVGQDEPISGYWVKEFGAPDDDFRILRLEPKLLAESSRLSQMALLTEHTRAKELQDPYVGTIFLRGLCDLLDIDGIEYPTVTGSFALDATALNLVLTSQRAIRATAALESEARPTFSRVDTQA